MASAEEHVQALLSLPVEDRAHAAKLLLDSIDDEAADPAAEAARADELTRRARAVADGTVEIVDAGEVRSRIVARLRYVRGQ